jgi:hypothetical protein
MCESLPIIAIEIYYADCDLWLSRMLTPCPYCSRHHAHIFAIGSPPVQSELRNILAGCGEGRYTLKAAA